MRDLNNMPIEKMHGVYSVEEEVSANSPDAIKFIEGLRGLGDQLGVNVGRLLDIYNNNEMER